MAAAKKIQINKGLDLPIQGTPEQTTSPAPVSVASVALVGPDYVGMRPTMHVKVGDQVKLGDPVFSCKKTPGVRYTSPAAGKVTAIHRGEKRALDSVEIELDNPGVGDDEPAVTFEKATAKPVEEQSSQEIRSTLVESGMWTALRARPYSKVPAPDAEPHSIFVTAIDTNPLAADPEVVLASSLEEFQRGLVAVAALSACRVFVCRRPGASLVGANPPGQVEEVEFDGPHPAGLVGTHVHFLDPVGPKKTVWHIGYQDVVAIGKLFATGRVAPDRTIALSGPKVKNPRLVRTRLGADLAQLMADELEDGDIRVISGSVLSGRRAAGTLRFLGRYHLQVSAVEEGNKREFLGWQSPGFDKFSVKRVFLSSLTSGKKFAFSTSTGGSRRAMVPVGSYEKVVPLDMEPTFLLRALLVKDTDQAQALGCLELDEEDLGLCSFVCPGKEEYGPILRENLTIIERDG